VPSDLLLRLPVSLRYLAWILNTVKADKYQDQYDFFFSFHNGFIIPGTVPHIYFLSGPPLLPQLENPPEGVRGIPFRTFRLIYKKVLRHLLPAYEYDSERRYVINSEFTAKLFEQAHGKRLQVVYPPIRLPDVRVTPGDLATRDSALYFSRIVDYKRPHLLADVAAASPEMRCVIMGGTSQAQRWYLKQLQQRVCSCHLENLEIIVDPCNERVKREMQRARYYIFPGVNEHFGMTTVEAIAAGALPVVHDSGGQREIVRNPLLRFRGDAVVAKLKELSKMSFPRLEALREDEMIGARRFSEEVFISKMLGFLDQTEGGR